MAAASRNIVAAVETFACCDDIRTYDAKLTGMSLVPDPSFIRTLALPVLFILTNIMTRSDSARPSRAPLLTPHKINHV